MLFATLGCETPEVAVGHGQVEDTDEGAPPPPAMDGDDTDGGDTDDPPTSMSFVPEGDYEQISTCDPFAQDCERGFKCVPYGSSGGNWDANKCVPVLGDGKLGDPCTYDGTVEATDTCDASSMCWNLAQVDGVTVGTCSAFCTGTADDPMCPAGSSCSISCDGSLTVCIQSCHPLEQDCLGLGCYWAGSSFSCIFTTQDLETGEACGFINDCKPGNACIDAEVMPDCAGSACCSAFCDLLDPACAQAQTECAAFFETGTAPPGYEKVGICILAGA